MKGSSKIPCLQSRSTGRWVGVVSPMQRLSGRVEGESASSDSPQWPCLQWLSGSRPAVCCNALNKKKWVFHLPLVTWLSACRLCVQTSTLQTGSLRMVLCPRTSSLILCMLQPENLEFLPMMYCLPYFPQLRFRFLFFLAFQGTDSYTLSLRILTT